MGSNPTLDYPDASPVHPSTLIHRFLLICLISLAAPLHAESAEPDEEKADSKAQAADKKPSPPLVKVKVTGVEDELLKNAEAYLEIRAKKDEPNLTQAWIQHLHNQSAEEIKTSLQLVRPVR